MYGGLKFVSNFSYDIKHNEEYAELLGITERLKWNIESETDEVENQNEKNEIIDELNQEADQEEEKEGNDEKDREDAK